MQFSGIRNRVGHIPCSSVGFALGRMHSVQLSGISIWVRCILCNSVGFAVAKDAFRVIHHNSESRNQIHTHMTPQNGVI